MINEKYGKVMTLCDDTLIFDILRFIFMKINYYGNQLLYFLSVLSNWTIETDQDHPHQKRKKRKIFLLRRWTVNPFDPIFVALPVDSMV